MKKIVRAIFIFSILTSFVAFAQTDRDSSIQGLSFGASVDGNLYSSNFSELLGCPDCAKYDDVIYNNAFGVGYSIFAGYERKILSNNKLRLGGNVVFSNLSAEYYKETKFSNWIDGDVVSDAISAKILSVSAQYLGLNPYIRVQPFAGFEEEIPLSLQFGLNVGTLISAKYQQKEKMISPDKAYFENGTKERNIAEGDLPEKSSLFFGLSVAVAYDLCHFSNFDISPLITLNYGLSNLANDTRWKVNSLNVGVNLRYNIPVYKEPPFVPVQPMMPKLPEPKAIIPPPPPPPPPPVVMKKVPAEMYITTTTETLLPIIYFENGTDKIIPGYDANLLSLIRKSNLVQSVYVTMGIGDNEGTINALPKLRASVIEKLIGSKISYHTESLNIGKATRIKEPEIKAEYSYAYFKNFDDSYIAKIDTNITQYVEITEDSVYTPVIYYLTNSAPSKYYTDEYVLGFFKFDDESIQHKNYNNISRIINALEEGKRIEIIAYTDDFGIDEYNAKLAMKRAKVTMNEINKYKKYTKQITLKGEIYKNYDHNNAYERSNNRRVIVRILK